jgi:hypothetical protein
MVFIFIRYLASTRFIYMFDVRLVLTSVGRIDPLFLYERIAFVVMTCICKYIYDYHILLSLRR